MVQSEVGSVSYIADPTFSQLGFGNNVEFINKQKEATNAAESFSNASSSSSVYTYASIGRPGIQNDSLMDSICDF